MANDSNKQDFDDGEFAARLRTQLRAGERELDTRTRARLEAARRTALEQAPADSEPQGWSIGFGAPAWGTVATVAAVALLVSQTWQPETPVPPADETQLELIETLELLEFYEDLEFYEWLAETDFEEMSS